MLPAVLGLLLLCVLTGGCRPATSITAAEIYADNVLPPGGIPASTGEITLKVHISAPRGAEITVFWYYLEPDFILHQEELTAPAKQSMRSFSLLRPLEGWLPGEYAAAIYLEKRRYPAAIRYFTLEAAAGEQEAGSPSAGG